jgi:DNA primase
MNASIPEHVLDEIRARSDILEVVSQHVPLKKKGRNYFGLCPFHTEKTPSFSVNQEKQIFHCFGCGSGGDVFRFLMELDKVSFVEAVRSLAQRSGLSLPESRVDVAKASANEQLYRACEFARDYFHAMLLNDKRAEPARAYLRDRAIAEETISRFKLGSAIPGWDHLLNAAARSSLSEKLLESAGLVVPRADDGYYDRFRNRLIFPVDTASGRTVAFAGRALTSETEPKYLNSPETPIYHKGELLYGLAEARDAVRKDGYVLLVEGYVDALRLFQAGIENVVACAGTAFTEAHAWSLARYGPKVVLVYDADPAGESGHTRLSRPGVRSDRPSTGTRSG